MGLADVQQRKGKCQHTWFYLFRHGMVFRGVMLDKVIIIRGRFPIGGFYVKEALDA
jgi:predicted LPLAT superfamily acyltransferase